MDLAGLVDSIYEATLAIDFGRKGFATRGKAEEGRISYEHGIALALSCFQQAQTTADPHIIILAEYTFLTQELHLSNKTDKETQNSLTKAVQSFDDAFLALNIVENSALYQGAEQTHPRKKEHRVKGGYPKDSYHIACNSHKTRIKNILSSPGIDPIEKSLLHQRLANLPAAQNAYIAKQQKALG